MTSRSIGKLFIGDDLVHGNSRGRNFPRRQREKSGTDKARNNNQNNTNAIHIRSAIQPAILSIRRGASPDRQSGQMSDNLLCMARICLQYGIMDGIITGGVALFEAGPPS